MDVPVDERACVHCTCDGDEATAILLLAGKILIVTLKQSSSCAHKSAAVLEPFVSNTAELLKLNIVVETEHTRRQHGKGTRKHSV